jgi:hypothetical protein
MNKKNLQQLLNEIEDIEDMMASHEDFLFKYPDNEKLLVSHGKLEERKRELEKEINRIELGFIMEEE